MKPTRAPTATPSVAILLKKLSVQAPNSKSNYPKIAGAAAISGALLLGFGFLGSFYYKKQKAKDTKSTIATVLAAADVDVDVDGDDVEQSGPCVEGDSFEGSSFGCTQSTVSYGDGLKGFDSFEGSSAQTA